MASNQRVNKMHPWFREQIRTKSTIYYILMLQYRSSDKGKRASQILIYYLIYGMHVFACEYVDVGNSVCVCVLVWG